MKHVGAFPVIPKTVTKRNTLFRLNQPIESDGMKKVALIGVLGAWLLSASAMADQYAAAIDGCREAIGKQMGLMDVDTRYKLKKVKSRATIRDLGFVVSARDESNTIQGVVVTCKVRRSGQVVALDFVDERYGEVFAAQ